MGKDLNKEIERLEAENNQLIEDRDRAIQKIEEQELALAEKSALIESQTARQEDQIARQLNSQRKARIIIASGKDSHERCPVPVGINGREFLIERDKPVDVPEGVLNVLDMAVAVVGESSDSGGMVDTRFRKAPRFAYRMLGWINPETGDLEKA